MRALALEIRKSFFNQNYLDVFGRNCYQNTLISATQYNNPAIAPVKQVARVPERIDFGASETISWALSLHIPLKPAIIIPKLPKFAKPQIA